jgi:hypothetical protein
MRVGAEALEAPSRMVLVTGTGFRAVWQRNGLAVGVKSEFRRWL